MTLSVFANIYTVYICIHIIDRFLDRIVYWINNFFEKKSTCCCQSKKTITVLGQTLTSEHVCVCVLWMPLNLISVCWFHVVHMFNSKCWSKSQVLFFKSPFVPGVSFDGRTSHVNLKLVKPVSRGLDARFTNPTDPPKWYPCLMGVISSWGLPFALNIIQ